MSDSGIISEITVLGLQPVHVVKAKNINSIRLMHNNNYIQDELKEFMIDTSYIDEISKNNLLREISKTDVNIFSNMPKKFFISYSKNELQYLQELKNHLSNLSYKNQVECWYDGMIEPGVEWDETIKAQLNESDVVICLLSPFFMSNKYIWEVEMVKAKEKLGNKNIIPIFITKCDIDGTFLDARNGSLTIKHLPEGNSDRSNYDNGIIWISLEEHQPKRDFYYALIIKHLKSHLSIKFF